MSFIGVARLSGRRDHAGDVYHRNQVRIMFIAVLLFTTAAAAAQAQKPQQLTAQQLFDSGKYQDAITKIKATPNPPPEQAYLQAQADRKLNQNDEAKTVFGTLAARGEDDAWHFVGKSGIAMTDGDLPAAEEAAKKAVDVNGDLAEARYQLGLVLSARDNQAPAADAFAKAAELKPQMAYAQYEAGMAFYKVKRVDRMAVYFTNFLKLAPNAPETPAVQSIMRTVRGK
jgi:tetratricopeptide (TPR) repeat protein